jgi:co-chaperonin GroES (HSP10)
MTVMKALHNLVVIKIEEQGNKKTATGLYLPQDKWGEKGNVAEIVEHSIVDAPFKAGERVLINPYAVLDTPEKDLKLIKYIDILAVL